MKPVFVALIAIVFSNQSHAMVTKNTKLKITRSIVPGEIIIGLKGGSLSTKTAVLSGLIAGSTVKPLFMLGSKQVVKLVFDKSISIQSVKAKLRQNSEIGWVAPNYLYTGDLKDVSPLTSPNDPQYTKQVHHKLMQSEKGWETETGKIDIIVGITDDGMDTKHEDLVNQLWVNSKEIPDNKIDDDENGYVDDIHGWDFVANKAAVDPDSSSDTHGTHVAGIVAAEQNNGKGVSGVAPGVRYMILKWAGSGGGFTSEIVSKAYLYAAENGAKIVTTSYNVDGFVNDTLYKKTADTVYDKGVLQFNSAGNNNQKDPPRAVFTNLLLTCSTDADDKKNDEKSSFSNYGVGVDVCAPGGKVYSTVYDNKYDFMSGTSMSSPNAAAVAALIWSRHPDWTREQVAAQLIGTADDLDGKNSLHKGLLGSGRVNVARAIDDKIAPPFITGVKELNGAPIAAPTQLTVLLKRVFDPATVLNAKNWELVTLTADGSEQAIDVTIDTSYRVGTNEFAIKPVKALVAGTYKLTAKSGGLKDPFGQALNGNQDGRNGTDDYNVEFTVK